jgi:hypothetical protein
LREGGRALVCRVQSIVAQDYARGGAAETFNPPLLDVDCAMVRTLIVGLLEMHHPTRPKVDAQLDHRGLPEFGAIVGGVGVLVHVALEVERDLGPGQVEQSNLVLPEHCGEHSFIRLRHVVSS